MVANDNGIRGGFDRKPDSRSHVIYRVLVRPLTSSLCDCQCMYSVSVYVHCTLLTTVIPSCVNFWVSKSWSSNFRTWEMSTFMFLFQTRHLYIWCLVFLSPFSENPVWLEAARSPAVSCEHSFFDFQRNFFFLRPTSNSFVLLTRFSHFWCDYYRVFFSTGTPLKNSKFKKVNLG